MLIVLTGKTASGKDTIIAKILAKYPHFKKVLTTTSRALRKGEKNGLDYNFISRQDFRDKINRGDFLEYVLYGGNLYGTEKSRINPRKDLIWKIDPQRAGKIREIIKDDLLVIYISTSDEIILQRLKKRGLTDEEIKKRMADDKKIWQKYQGSYDYIVENVPGSLEKAVDQIIKIIKNSTS